MLRTRLPGIHHVPFHFARLDPVVESSLRSLLSSQVSALILAKRHTSIARFPTMHPNLHPATSGHSVAFSGTLKTGVVDGSDLKARSRRCQKYSSATPIRISATQRPTHKPCAPHPTRKQR